MRALRLLGCVYASAPLLGAMLAFAVTVAARDPYRIAAAVLVCGPVMVGSWEIICRLRRS